jgi:hypothetical protein
MAFYGVAIVGATAAGNFVSTNYSFCVWGKEERESGENMACKGAFVTGPRVVRAEGSWLVLSR